MWVEHAAVRHTKHGHPTPLILPPGCCASMQARVPKCKGRAARSGRTTTTSLRITMHLTPQNARFSRPAAVPRRPWPFHTPRITQCNSLGSTRLQTSGHDRRGQCVRGAVWAGQPGRQRRLLLHPHRPGVQPAGAGGAMCVRMWDTWDMKGRKVS